VTRASGVVTAVNAPGTGVPTVTVSALGGSLPNLRYPAWWAPQVGDRVLIDSIGQQFYVAEIFAGTGAYTPAGAVQPFLPGAYYSSPATGNSTAGPAPNTCSVIPFPVSRQSTFDLLGVEVTQVAAAGGAVRLGVYRDTGYGAAGQRVLDAGAVPTTGLGLLTVGVALTLTPGLYWLAAQVEVTQAFLRSVTASVGGLYGLQATTGGVQLDGYYATSGITPGALPDPFPSSVGQAANLAKVLIRAS